MTIARDVPASSQLAIRGWCCSRMPMNMQRYEMHVSEGVVSLVAVPSRTWTTYGTGTRRENEEPPFRRPAFCEFSFGSNCPSTRSRKWSMIDCGRGGDGQVSPQTETSPLSKGGWSQGELRGSCLHRLVFELARSGWVDPSL